ncbi:SigB/SigF/SigG family RNA polymerase sigma factor [Rhodococcus globerulus]|uniref:SigB/SigF/SigG family RNA polymerase sigma factor n=1 Tax=Rhodococcus globerulus TaxID=33008 RepID=UPI0035B55391
MTLEQTTAGRFVPHSARDGNDYAFVTDLFADLAALPGNSPEYSRLRADIIEQCLPIAENIAKRYRGRGQPHDDLVQVARVGLINAVNRFDLAKGADFLSFAVPTIMGEVRKHFRDRSWGVRVPRSLQEQHLALKKAIPSLTQALGREPTIDELADELNVDREEVGTIVAVGDSYRTSSIDAEKDGEGRSLADVLGEHDDAIDAIDNHHTLRPALLALPERQRTILLYRFFGELTQSEIAEKVGLSQMHVSRMLTQSLRTLRTELGDVAHCA